MKGESMPMTNSWNSFKGEPLRYSSLLIEAFIGNKVYFRSGEETQQMYWELFQIRWWDSQFMINSNSIRVSINRKKVYVFSNLKQSIATLIIYKSSLSRLRYRNCELVFQLSFGCDQSQISCWYDAEKWETHLSSRSIYVVRFLGNSWLH